MPPLYRIILPYCLVRQPDGSYAVINREQKPLGFSTAQWIEYGDYPIQHKLQRLGPVTASYLSSRESKDLSCIALYHDGCNPLSGNDLHWDSYVRRLKLLSQLVVK